MADLREVPDNVFAVSSRIRPWGGGRPHGRPAHPGGRGRPQAPTPCGRPRSAGACSRTARPGRPAPGGGRPPRARADVRGHPGHAGAARPGRRPAAHRRARDRARLRHPQPAVPPGAHRSPRTQWRRAVAALDGCWRASRDPPADSHHPLRRGARTRPAANAAARARGPPRCAAAAATPPPRLAPVSASTSAPLTGNPGLATGAPPADVDRAVTRAHAASSRGGDGPRARCAGAWSSGSASCRPSISRSWPTSSASRWARSSRSPAGEVQEMIDVCDLAVGLSRQTPRTLPSELPGHRADGDLAPARRRRGRLARSTSRRGLGVERRDRAGLRRHRGVEAVGGDAAGRRGRGGAAGVVGAPEGLNTVVVTDACGRRSPARHPRGPAVSATGSERMGAQVAPRVAPGSAGLPPLGVRRRRHAVGGPRPRRAGIVFLGPRARLGSRAPRCGG